MKPRDWSIVTGFEPLLPVVLICRHNNLRIKFGKKEEQIEKCFLLRQTVSISEGIPSAIFRYYPSHNVFHFKNENLFYHMELVLSDCKKVILFLFCLFQVIKQASNES